MSVLRRVVPLLLAWPAFGDQMAESGWKLYCGPDNCTLAAAGFTFRTTPDSDPAALANLQDLSDLSAVDFAGQIVNMGDSSADLVLAEAQRGENIHEGNLQYLQGDWAPVGEETPYFIRIENLDYQEWVQDELGASFAMILGDSCADGTVHSGTIISLYRYGDDPAADGCWQLEYIDDTSMTLRDLMGDWGAVDYNRVTN